MLDGLRPVDMLPVVILLCLNRELIKFEHLANVNHPLNHPG
jgi:hypothetical protein